MQVATNVAGTMNGGARVERRSYSNINRNTRAKQNSRMLAVVIIAGIMCLMMVVDSLNTKINDASNINKIEKTATEKFGMVHSESQNCITIGDSKSSSKTNLASAIKDEAYE